MIRKVKHFDIPRFSPRERSGRLRLSPEEDAIILGGETDDIDETLPADLWFHHRPRRGMRQLLD